MIVLLALFLCPSLAAYEPPELDPRKGYTAFAIPHTDKAPELDGVIAEGEWDDAFLLNASGDQHKAWNYLYPRWTKWRMMWDEDHLYISAESQRLPNEDLRIWQRDPTREANTVADDSVEIHLSPGGRNTPEDKLPWKAQAIINPLEVGYYSKYIWRIAARTTTWSPDWEMGSKMHEDSWVLEIAVTRESLDLEEPNRPGDLWSFLLARNWKFPGWNQSTVPCSDLESFKIGPENFPFGYLTDGVYARLKDVSGLFDGRIHTLLELGTAGNEPENVDIKLFVKGVDGKGDGEEAFEWEKTATVKVKPDDLTTWKINRKDALEDGKTYRYYLKVNAPSLEEPILEENFLVKPGSDERLREKAAELEHQPFRFRGDFAPTQYKFKAQADFLFSDQKDSVNKLAVKIREEGSSETLFQGTAGDVRHAIIEKRFQLPELGPGTYEWAMKLFAENGDTLATGTGTFKKKNESETYEWWDFKGGNTAKVLWPYEPVALENGGTRAHWWGGTYHLNGLCLPRQVQVTANEKWRPDLLEKRPSVLARPVEVTAEQGGETAQIAMQGFPRTNNVAEHKASMEGYAHIGKSVEVKSTASFHQDGLLWINMKMRPGRQLDDGESSRRDKATLESLVVDIPLRESIAKSMHAYGSPGKGSYTIGPVPDGEGVVWDCTEVGTGGGKSSSLTVGNMVPVVWLGSWQRGLAFFARNNKGWAHAGHPDQQILRRGDQVVLRLNIIQKPVTIEDQREIAFGLMPTPMRKMVPGWRMLNCSFVQNFRRYSWGKRGNASLDPEVYLPTRRNMYRNTSQMITKLGGQEVAPHTERAGWESRVRDRAIKGYFGAEWDDDTWTRRYQNYQLHLMQKWIEEGGMTGIYHDQFYPHCMQNTITGAAYALPDGRTNAGYNMLKDRKFNQREYALFRENGIKPRIFCHTTNGGQLISYPWVTAILDGEANPIQPGDDYDFSDLYPPERMQAYGNPWPWGNTFYWMRVFDAGGEKWTRKQNRAYEGWTLLHDVFYRGDNVFDVSRKKLARWGMNDSRVKFWPYWANEEVVSCSNDDVLVSMWTLPDRTLVCAFNYGDSKAEDVTVRIPLRDLELMPKVRAEYIEARNLAGGNSGFDAWSGSLSVSIPTHDFRLISIRTFKE